MILADGTPMPTQARPLSNEQAHSLYGPAGGRSRWVFHAPGWPLSPLEWDVRSAGNADERARHWEYLRNSACAISTAS